MPTAHPKVSRARKTKPAPETKAVLAALRRMTSTRETIEVLKDRKAMKAIREFEAGKITFKPASVLDEL